MKVLGDLGPVSMVSQGIFLLGSKKAGRPFPHLINNPAIDLEFPKDSFITLSSTVCGGNYRDNGNHRPMEACKLTSAPS